MTQVNRRNFLKAGGAAAAVGLSGCIGGLGGGGGTPTVRLAYVVPVENYGSLMSVPEIQDEMPNMGDAYEIEITRTQATTDGIASLAAGDLDMTYMTTISYANAIAQSAVPSGIKAISTDFWDAHPDYFGITVYSKGDSGITEAADLEGKKLATTALGTGIQAVYVKNLQAAGLTRDDVEFVELAFPAFTQAINDGRVDAGIYPAFFAGQARSAGFNEVCRSQDVFSQYPFAYVCASNSALDAKGDAIRAWGEDFAHLIELSNTDRDMVVSAAANHFEVPQEMLDAYYLTDLDYYRGQPQMDVEALNTILNEMVDIGFLDEERDYAEYVSNDYLPS